MVATALLAAFGLLIVLLIGAVYSAMIVAKKTDEMIRNMHDEPVYTKTRQERHAHGRSLLGNA